MTNFETLAKHKLERTLRDHKDRLEHMPKHYGKERKRNYSDWLKQEIQEIEAILKEAERCQNDDSQPSG